jgi:hypothetical protein
MPVPLIITASSFGPWLNTADVLIVFSILYFFDHLFESTGARDRVLTPAIRQRR